MCDDGERAGKLIKLVGDAVFACVNYLISQDQFKPDSDIKNLGLVLAMFLVWGGGYANGCDKSGIKWCGELVTAVEDNHVTLYGPYQIEDTISRIKGMFKDRPRLCAHPWADKVRRAA